MPGVLGDFSGQVNAGGGMVYVQVAQTVEVALCLTTPKIAGLQVWVGYTPHQPDVLQVLGQRVGYGTSASQPQPGVAAHAASHEYMGTGPIGGTDVVKVQLPQFMPLRVFPFSGLTVAIYPGIIRGSLNYLLIADTNALGMPIPKTLDMTYEGTNVVGKAVYVLISINQAGAVVMTRGAEMDLTALALSDIPAPPADTLMVLAAVRLYYGQDSIAVNRNSTDIIDLRYPIIHNHSADGSSGGGGSGMIDPTTAIGDLIFREYATDLIKGENAINLNYASLSASSEVIGHEVGYVTDWSLTTYWQAGVSPVAGSYIDVDLGAAVELWSCELVQSEDPASAAIWYLYYSDDGVTYVQSSLYGGSASYEEVYNPAGGTHVGAHRYYRIYADSGGTGPWKIFEWRLYRAVAIAGLGRLPASLNGDVLTLVSGKPAWVTPVLNKTDAITAPTIYDDSGDGFSANSVWLDITNKRAYICLDATVGAAVWKEITEIDTANYMINPMTTAGDMIYQPANLALANSDATGNKIINESPSSTERIIPICDLTIPNPLGNITIAWNVWVSMSQLGTQKKVMVRLRRDSVNGEILWSQEKTMATDSVAGHDQQFTSSMVDTLVTTGRYVLTSDATGASTVAIYGDTRTFTISGATNDPSRLPIGTEGQVQTVLSGQPAWENHFYRGRVFSEDFRANLPSGWAWAASPFVTPPTVTLVDNTILRWTGYTAASRSFLYKAITTARNYYLLCPVYRLSAANYVGWRIDDGSDNNYAEYYHAPQSDGSFSLLKKVRTGGGAATETLLKNYPAPIPWATLYPYVVGTQWSDWYVDFYLLGPGIPTVLLGSTGAPHFAFTPTRAGFVLSVSAANYLFADIDAWNNA